MRTKETNVLFSTLVLSHQVPSTVEEAESLVGEPGAVLEGFIADCAARNFLPRLYSDVADKLKEAGQSKLEVGKRKTKEGEAPIYENDTTFIDRVRTAAEKEGNTELVSKIDGWLVEVGQSIPFYAERERTGGGGKIAAGVLEAANSLHSGGVEKVEEAVAKIEASVPGYVVSRTADGEVTVDALARGIAAFQKHLIAKAAAETKSALGL